MRKITISVFLNNLVDNESWIPRVALDQNFFIQKNKTGIRRSRCVNSPRILLIMERLS